MSEIVLMSCHRIFDGMEESENTVIPGVVTGFKLFIKGVKEKKIPFVDARELQAFRNGRIQPALKDASLTDVIELQSLICFKENASRNEEEVQINVNHYIGVKKGTPAVRISCATCKKKFWRVGDGKDFLDKTFACDICEKKVHKVGAS